ncbi:prephenate dehydrogenase/arogenate dehydrogenase family protein [Sphingomonas suaedae]|uniref:Prephenate dehydrogenase/arogenate dehydrogenase family protein n=1 Tax=Sphingomonas suaedae TaxID=2599297 RepID=A0A518RIM5_9SPHN|nr:prephenate dehydrogenase/arogenate dehydrogenase family protein [Sphingomonas suaedae]QDX27279.1 prephenate dehydrogenase/arogenate dehydrogenase family protein [Sphingomonas suaedae]
MKRFGIIGFGRFGQLAARHLRDHFDVVVCDAHDPVEDAGRIGVRTGSLAEIAGCDTVMLAVPVQALEQMLAEIAPHVRPGALVVDVASVKMLPARWMAEALPESVDIVATHPLFGPQSARRGLEGQPLVICPVRGEAHHRVAEFGRTLGLKVSITTPEEHDREMAYVQALTHLIGRTLVNIRIPDEELKTDSYQHLLELCALIGDDSEELFFAIQNLNPFAQEITQQFIGQANGLLDRSLKAGNRSAPARN